MSFTFLRYCPISECKFNSHPIHADYAQIKRHLREHTHKELLQTAIELNLISQYAYPDKHSLVEYLAGISKVGGIQNG